VLLIFFAPALVRIRELLYNMLTWMNKATSREHAMQKYTLMARVNEAMLEGHAVTAEITETLAGGPCTLDIYIDGELLGRATTARNPDEPRLYKSAAAALSQCRQWRVQEARIVFGPF